MPASPADSALYGRLFCDDEVARLFSDSAEIRAMLLVEGALARAQGGLGLIPAEAAAFLHRAAYEVQIDPGALAAETSVNGVPVPALVAAFRKAVEAPDHAQYLHWGATSQDIMDTALALRLKRMFDIFDARLAGLVRALGRLASEHADLPLAARTYGQVATPTSLGCVVAGWGWPLIAAREGLADLRGKVERVSLSGAAGTLGAMGPKGPEVRAALAQALGLADPGHGWHSDRSGMAALAGWTAGIAGSLGKMAEDLILACQSGLAEVRLEGGGGSSTMPQKQNPVAPSVIVALSRQVIALSGVVQGAGLHRQQRDGAAWFQEWLSLPQVCILTGRIISLTEALVPRIVPDPVAMARAIEADGGVIHAEAISFALAETMPRPEAQAAVKALCQRALQGEGRLIDLVAAAYPGRDWTGWLARQGLGQAPSDARAFARAAGDAAGSGEGATA